MNITTKYDIGDTVFYPQVINTKVAKECPDCLGTRSWQAHLPNGEQIAITCPVCKYGYESTGVIHEYELEGTIQTLTVGSLDINTHGNVISYMCKETGVGSGRTYHEKDLFPTYEEAQALIPKMLEDQQIDHDEARATSRARKIAEGPGRMAAYYRAQIRDAKKAIKQAEDGIKREESK